MSQEQSGSGRSSKRKARQKHDVEAVLYTSLTDVIGSKVVEPAPTININALEVALLRGRSFKLLGDATVNEKVASALKAVLGSGEVKINKIIAAEAPKAEVVKSAFEEVGESGEYAVVAGAVKRGASDINYVVTVFKWKASTSSFTVAIIGSSPSEGRNIVDGMSLLAERLPDFVAWLDKHGIKVDADAVSKAVAGLDHAGRVAFATGMLASMMKTAVTVASSPSNAKGFAESLLASKTEPATSRENGLPSFEWTEEARKYREVLLTILSDWNRRLGIEQRAMTSFPALLLYAAVVSSDYRMPPVVIHAVGDPGTFKTTGVKATMLKSIQVPVVELRYKGPDADNKLTELRSYVYELVGEIPQNEFGGLVSVREGGSSHVVVDVSIPHLTSYLGLDKYREVVEAIKEKAEELGFEVREISRPPAKFTIETSMLENLEKYRYRYLVVGESKQIVTQNLLFDNHIVIVDEAARAGEGRFIDGLLTKLSDTSVNTSHRVVVITDNYEPYVQLVSSRRADALMDRTLLALTDVTKSADSEEAFDTSTEVTVSAVDLLRVMKLVKSMPFPEASEIVLSAISEALSKKARVTTVGDTKVVALVPRNLAREGAFYDPFASLGDFYFVPGGRFRDHTKLLAKFIAFMRGHDRVTVDDLKTALSVTVPSRVATRATGTSLSVFFNNMVEAVASVIDEKSTYMISTASAVVSEIAGTGESPTFNTLITSMMSGDETAVFGVLAAIEAVSRALARGTITRDRLPPSVRETLIVCNRLPADRV